MEESEVTLLPALARGVRGRSCLLWFRHRRHGRRDCRKNSIFEEAQSTSTSPIETISNAVLKKALKALVQHLISLFEICTDKTLKWPWCVEVEQNLPSFGSRPAILEKNVSFTTE
jgi:hypothetical protein